MSANNYSDVISVRQGGGGTAAVVVVVVAASLGVVNKSQA